jgi:flagellin-like hook-associated protein FlgL
MSEIVLSPGVRQNLLALQNTAHLLSITQNRLATGKKVNSALDNPISYFTSQALNQRVSDLNALLDSIGQAQQTLKAADDGITSLTKLVQSAKSIATQALQTARGNVNYTNITGTAVLPADTTKVSATANVGTAGVASAQATATLNAAGIAALANGEVVTFKLGSGAVVTATKGAAVNLATNTFNTAADLINVLNTGTGASGNLSGQATAASDGAGGVTATSLDVTQDFTTGTTGTLGAGNLTSVAHILGDALTISDGTHTQTFYRVAAGASAANGTFSNAANLKTAIDATPLVNGGGPVVATVNGNGVDLSRADGGDIAFSGSLAVADGYTTTPAQVTYNSNYNSLLSTLSGTLTVTVGSNQPHTITFGPGLGQIFTRSGLNTALNAFADVGASVDGSNHVNFAPSSSDTVTIGGTGAILTALGLTAGGTTPAATVITPNASRASFQVDYNNLLTQVDQLAKDAAYNGVNILYGDSLKVVFNPDGTSSLTIAGVKLDSNGLGLTAITGTGFQDDTVVNTTLTKIDAALAQLRTQASKFGTNVTVVQVREDFTRNLITTLQVGSDNLVLADTNEEGANLLALQTRQQLSTTALSLANQASQAVLRLFS